MASSAKPKTRQKYFTDRSPGYQYLANAFEEFDNTKGKSGIDYKLRDKKDIDSVYQKYSIFHEYSDKCFPDNFRNLSNKHKIGLYKDRKRNDSPSKFFYFTTILFYSFILFVSILP